MTRVFVLLFFLALVSCKPGEDQLNKFADKNFVKIADLQDHRLSDSLYQFFNHENPAYRRDAVLAFASIQDTLAIDTLAKILKKDSDQNVRSAAAYSLGQTGTVKSFRALLDALATEKNALVKREILEACGKTSPDGKEMPLLTPGETLSEEGFAWLCYRLGLRGIADSMIVTKAVALLPNDNASTRVGIANFFSRGPKNISIAENALQKSATNDPSPDVRMAATAALRKINTPSTLETIKGILSKDKDYRVRISAVRALQAFPLKDTKQNLIDALSDSNQNVMVAASEVIKSVATKDDFSDLVSLARGAKNWRVQGNLFEAALAVSNNKEITEEIVKLYEIVQNPYAKAALISALGQSTTAYSFVSDQLNSSKVPVIKSSAAAALVSINSRKDFDMTLRKTFIDIYKKAFATGDAAVIGTIAPALMDSVLGYKKVLTDYTFLYDAKNKLSLPKDNESLQTLEAAIAYFEGKAKVNPVKNEFNHPIDWSLVKSIPADQKVRIKTSKGEIIIQLLVEEAPGSVANFVQLVNSQYFDSKNFHRVVPNFVIQGGCNRGDGWGSEDYSIRSEFSMRHYAEGSVGMASAGKDTEGTQWFITHSPTPHLDGRYSIFAVVTKGMDVVHQIEVGDTILKVELLK